MTGLVYLLKSDLERHYFYTGRVGKEVRVYHLWRNFLVPRCSPVGIYRLSRWLHEKRMVPLAKILTWVNFFLFGIEIASNCEIGPHFYMPHASGTVIGAMSIGHHAVIYHQVTIGAKDIMFSYDARPVVGDHVLIASGAKIIGDIVIGNGCVIAANAVVNKSTPENCMLAGVPAKPTPVRRRPDEKV
ncbi:serine O-acetyltransferase [Sphingomonas sp. TX0543]|uniref:serine O-acetyltransferase n=1 Tax=unclassified Sphingomonas TaxID=196159 RepID=UPI0010F9D7C4|nr:serine acetyltransferase [Sphingomonas sp. 3P27F8]